MIVKRITRLLNGSNIIALGLILFGSVVIAETISIYEISRYTGYISPFIGVMMFLIKYIQGVIKDGRVRLDQVEKHITSQTEIIKSLDIRIAELNILIIKNTTNIAVNNAKLEVIGKYGQLEERLRLTERKIKSMESANFIDID